MYKPDDSYIKLQVDIINSAVSSLSTIGVDITDYYDSLHRLGKVEQDKETGKVYFRTEEVS